jgi:hypothetical protein
MYICVYDLNPHAHNAPIKIAHGATNTLQSALWILRRWISFCAIFPVRYKNIFSGRMKIEEIKLKGGGNMYGVAYRATADANLRRETSPTGRLYKSHPPICSVGCETWNIARTNALHKKISPSAARSDKIMLAVQRGKNVTVKTVGRNDHAMKLPKTYEKTIQERMNSGKMNENAGKSARESVLMMNVIKGRVFLMENKMKTGLG